MKKKLMRRISLFIIAGLLIGLSGCDKDNPIKLPSMKATVDGVAWTSIFRLSALTESVTPNFITITGTPTVSATADKTIIISVIGTEVGTYTLGLGTLTAQCGVIYKLKSDAAEDDSNYYVAYKATVNITKLDKENKKMSGTFSATLRTETDPLVDLNITNGTFENLNYTVN